MSNMSYCRFENTSRDLADCHQALDAMILGDNIEPLSADELAAAKRLVKTCQSILSIMGEAHSPDPHLEIDDICEVDFAETLDRVNDDLKEPAADPAAHESNWS